MLSLTSRVFLSALLTGPLLLTSGAALAEQAIKPRPIPVKQGKRVLSRLSVQERTEAAAFIKENPKTQTAVRKLCASLKRLEQAHAALKKHPGNLRLVKRIASQARRSQASAIALGRLLRPPATTKNSKNQAQLIGGAKTVNTLAKNLKQQLDGTVSISSKGKKNGLGEEDMSSLNDKQIITTRDRGTLLGIIEPVIYR